MMKPFRLWIYYLLVHNLPETRFWGVKVALLRWCGAQVGTNVRINSSARFAGNGQLTIGDDVWIGAGDVISPVDTAEISIGSHVDLGPQVMLITGSHTIDPVGSHVGGKGIAESVTIGDGCWLGARVTVLPGVELGRKVVVAAGAVVTKPMPQDSLVAGVPAEVKKAY